MKIQLSRDEINIKLHSGQKKMLLKASLKGNGACFTTPPCSGKELVAWLDRACAALKKLWGQTNFVLEDLFYELKRRVEEDSHFE